LIRSLVAKTFQLSRPFIVCLDFSVTTKTAKVATIANLNFCRFNLMGSVTEKEETIRHIFS
jgi:hypothetical protein